MNAGMINHTQTLDDIPAPFKQYTQNSKNIHVANASTRNKRKLSPQDIAFVLLVLLMFYNE